MKLTEQIMGMPVAIEVLDNTEGEILDETLLYFHEIDNLFSPYKKMSEISQINAKKLPLDEVSPIVRKVLKLCEETKRETHGYFDIRVESHIDPSGLVKGYAIWEAAQKLWKYGLKNFYIEIGGDIDVRGMRNGQKWKIGLTNPLRPHTPAIVLQVSNVGVATSGLINKGLQIYNPIKNKIASEIVSLTVIAPNIYEADRFSTAAYAMGVERGLEFLEKCEGMEAMLFAKDGRQLATTGIGRFLMV